MVLRGINLEQFDGYETPDDICNEDMTTYYFLIHGYSIDKNIGFFISERGSGYSLNDAIFDAYDKVRNRLLIRYHIQYNEMKIDKYMELSIDDKRKRTGFAFHPLDEETIQLFRDDEKIEIDK